MGDQLTEYPRNRSFDYMNDRNQPFPPFAPINPAEAIFSARGCSTFSWTAFVFYPFLLDSVIYIQN